MRILFLSFYYQPDLSAGSFRNSALVEALQAELPKGSKIEVITTLPSRYASFSVDAPEIEDDGCVVLHRIPLPGHKSGILDQSRAFLTYARNVVKLTKSGEYDLVYASSSRLMTAALGALVARKKKLPLYLDVRDIFVDTIKDVFSQKIVWAVKPLFSLIERFSFGQATKINLVSGGFASYFEERYPSKALSFFTNGIDKEFITVGADIGGQPPSDLPEVVYAGNMGEGQGLHSIIPKLAKYFEGRLRFKLLGDGGRKVQLAEALQEAKVSNVQLLPPVSRSELISIYQNADVLFLHLNNYDAFLKVLPSKIFEYAALGKPLWAGVSGFSANFLEDFVSNSAVFSPCDLQSAIDVFERLELKTLPRDEFVVNFSRENIMNKMAVDIIDTLEQG